MNKFPYVRKEMPSEHAFDHLVLMIERRLRTRPTIPSTLFARKLEIRALEVALLAMEFNSSGGHPDDFLYIPSKLRKRISQYIRGNT